MRPSFYLAKEMGKNWDNIKYCSEKMQPTKKKNKGVSLIFPHQLHQLQPSISPERPVYLVEEWFVFYTIPFPQNQIGLSQG